MKIKDDINRGLDQSDYQNIISDFVQYFKSKKYFLLVAQFGKVSFPGISDLDMFLLVKNNYLEKATKDYEKWLEKDPVFKYCFAHQPVMITSSGLPYLKHVHTLYEFNILESKNAHSLSIGSNNNQLLSLSWTTFLIRVVNSILYHTEVLSARKNLLVLKNLHQSEINLGGRSDAFEYSEQLRAAALKQKNGHEVVSEIKTTLENIFILIDKKFEDNYKREKIFNLSKNIKLIRSDKSELKEGNIFINSRVYDLFVKTIFWKRIPVEVEKYYKNLAKLNSLGEREGVRVEVVKPFGYSFYEVKWMNYAKSKARKFL